MKLPQGRPDHSCDRCRPGHRGRDRLVRGVASTRARRSAAAGL